MDRNEALRLLKGGSEGVAEWNRRRKAGEEIPHLREADLRGAHLIRADLRGANLGEADLGRAALVGADLREANLVGADLRGAYLGRADLDRARCRRTNFADVDLSEIQGLESIRHDGPSTVGIDTLVRSQGKIPEAFLRGCGVPNVLITHLPSLIGAMSPIQFSSYFISYSTKDEAFAQRLHSRMCDEGLRVWLAPEDVPGGKKLHEPSDEVIRVSDKLLLVLSPHSLNSAWVKTAIRQARTIEIQEGQRKLFPIGLVDFETLRDWEGFAAASGTDLGVEIREYFIPDFLRWTEHDAFEEGFARLLRDLKAEDRAAS
jgi:hypothetical protein